MKFKTVPFVRKKSDVHASEVLTCSIEPVHYNGTSKSPSCLTSILHVSKLEKYSVQVTLISKHNAAVGVGLLYLHQEPPWFNCMPTLHCLSPMFHCCDFNSSFALFPTLRMLNTVIPF